MHSKKNNRGKLRRILLQVFYRQNADNFLVPGNCQMANGFFPQQFSGGIKGFAGINRYYWLRHYLSNPDRFGAKVFYKNSGHQISFGNDSDKVFVAGYKKRPDSIGINFFGGFFTFSSCSMLKTGLIMQLPTVFIATPKQFLEKNRIRTNIILTTVYCQDKLVFKEADYG